MTNRESGEKLIKEAERIFARDLKAAIEDKDHNLAIRRAQEVVELLLKGALKVLGVDYPKVHDVGEVFVRKVKEKYPSVDEVMLERIKAISMWLGEARVPSFYFERDYNEEDAQRAFEDADFMVKDVKRVFNLQGTWGK
ncbi:MAG: HEPN domain-containing protein [Candidatus Binatia bacterium]